MSSKNTQITHNARAFFGLTHRNNVIEQALNELRELQPQNSKDILPPLTRLEGFLEKLGNPHLLMSPIIHIAGTNGKGSTLAFLQAMVEASGKKTHKFTSPHLVHFNERIQICGKDISDDELLTSIIAVKAVVDNQEILFFDIMMLIAIHAFSSNYADFILLETGMGGRLDATNIFEKPLITALSSISIDHVEKLGNSIEAIAKEKSGIARKDVPFFIGCQKHIQVYDIAKKHSNNCLCYADDFQSIKNDNVSLIGEHQVENASLAAAIAKEIGIAENYINAGLKNASWRGRLQNIKANLWIDGGHNTSAANALASQIKQWNKPTDIVICLSYKRNPLDLILPLLDIANSITIVPVTGFNGVLYDDIKDIENYISAQSEIKHLLVAKSWQNAIKSRQKNHQTLITGSLYLVGEVLKEHENN